MSDVLCLIDSVEQIRRRMPPSFLVFPILFNFYLFQGRHGSVAACPLALIV